MAPAPKTAPVFRVSSVRMVHAKRLAETVLAKPAKEKPALLAPKTVAAAATRFARVERVHKTDAADSAAFGNAR